MLLGPVRLDGGDKQSKVVQLFCVFPSNSKRKSSLLAAFVEGMVGGTAGLHARRKQVLQPTGKLALVCLKQAFRHGAGSSQLIFLLWCIAQPRVG